MRYVKLVQPLKPKPITNIYDKTSAALNRGSAVLISLMADDKLWAFIAPPAKRIDLIDLSDTFDLGLEAEFTDGQLVGWRKIAVF